MSLDRDYQARNVYNVQTTSNEMGRIIDKSIEDVMVNIHRLQSKRNMSPEKYGESLRRNKAILAELDNFRDELQNQTNELMGERQSYAWDIAEEKNDKLTRDFLNVKTIPSEFDRLPVSALESYLVRKTEGIPLSGRLWNMSGSTRNILEDWIGTGVTQGKSADRMAREAVKMMQNPLGATYEINGEKLKFSSFSDTLRATPKKGQYKNPYDAFKRIARNETNFAYRNADQERIDKLDFVVGKEVHLSNAHKSYDVCDNLAGKYPKTFIFNAWHLNCYSDDTEVQTNNGWKLFQDVTFDDKILSLNPQTRSVEYVGINKIMNRYYKDDMVRFHNNTLDILVTKDHDMVYLNRSNGDIKKCKAIDYSCNKGGIYRSSEYIGERVGHINIGPYKIPFDLFSQFMGYYLSDGSIVKDRPYRCTVSQRSTDPNYPKIKECLLNLDFLKVSCKDDGFHFHDEYIYKYLVQFGKCNNKYIPKEILNSHKNQIRIFLDAFLSCDGYVSKPKPFIGSRGTLCIPKAEDKRYMTTSPQMASDLGECVLKCGFRPAYYIQKKSNKPIKFKNGEYKQNFDCWIIAERVGQSSTQFKKDLVPYDGFVYDVELEKNHIMYLRRNRRTFWGHNCLCYVTTILSTKDEFARGVKSKNTIDRMPVGAERLAKTMAADPTQIKGTSSFTQMDWYTKNFNSKGEPLINNRTYLEPYANPKDLTYAPNSENYLSNARKGL